MSRRGRVRAVVLALLMVGSTFAMAGVGAANDGGTSDLFCVTQNGQNYEVTALGSGNQTVKEFYDYRKPSNSEEHNFTYSSLGTQDLQDNQVSNVFVYHGSEGYSLVLLHDELDVNDDDAPYGSTITFEFSNMDDGEWAVRDDNYTADGEPQDDNWDTEGPEHVVDWMWAEHRTDGGAFRGIADDEITINPRFNGDAEHWDDWGYSGDADNETDAWRLLGDGDYQQDLDMSASVTIAQGECSDTTDPEAALSVSPETAANGEDVSFDASASSDDEGIAEYRWDFDGDGEVDRTTESATTTHTYDAAETYEASVTVADAKDNTDSATATVEVTESDDGGETSLDATFSVSEETVANDEKVEFDAGESSGDIDSYDWDLGDGTEKSGEKVTHTYAEPDEYEATLTVSDGAGNSDTATKTITVEESSTKEGIEFVSATEVKVHEDYDSVLLNAEYFATDGYGTDSYPHEDVSAGTTLELPEEEGAVEGSMIGSVSADKNASDDETDFHERHLNHEQHFEQIKPDPVTTAFEGATETGDGTYEATFSYQNPNDETLSIQSSEFATGNVDGEPPAEFEPGEHEFSVEWTPETDDERVTWELDRSNFNRSATTAESPPAGDLGDDGDDGNDGGETDDPPTADFSVSEETVANDQTVTFDASASSDDEGIEEYRWDLGDGTEKSDEMVTHSYAEPGEYEVELTVEDEAGNTDTASLTVTVEKSSTEPPKDGKPSAKLSLTKSTADFDEKVGFDASGSSDDEGIVEYRWDFDDDGKVERTTAPEDAGKNDDPAIVWHEVPAVYDEPGEYDATVTVVDEAGNTDTASATLTVEKRDHEPPSATLHVPDTVEVGEEFTVKATDFTESNLSHVCWVFDDHDAPEGATANYTFEETGDEEVRLHLVDRAGNSNTLNATITVVEPKTPGDDPADDDPNKDDPNEDDPSEDPPEDGLDDDPPEDSKSGGVPSADPGGSSNDGSNDDSDDSTETKAPLDGNDGEVGELVLASSATADAAVEATTDAPDDVREPTADREGFVALSYAELSGGEDAEATFTVSTDRLDEMDAEPDDVTLFRFGDGTWNAVETDLLNATDDAAEFRADADSGTYAVGVDRPSTAVADLRLDDERVAPGDAATVVVTVSNDGLASGTHEVDLTVDGEVVATERVSVPADETREVEFTAELDESGVYAVSSGDASAELVVEGIETTETETTTEVDETTTTENADGGDDGADVPGFGVGAALAALAAAALLARRLN